MLLINHVTLIIRHGLIVSEYYRSHASLHMRKYFFGQTSFAVDPLIVDSEMKPSNFCVYIYERPFPWIGVHWFIII